MNAKKITYWISTGIVTLMMLFSAFMYLSSEEMVANFQHLGFPQYFRVELAIAKFIGAAILIIPMIPAKFKEWAYAGFAIVFISAATAHIASGDGIAGGIAPIIFLIILIVSYSTKQEAVSAS
ncbi:DoxX family protein [Chondrinema litorale]|uniref:DoxX family protein n=1 Tax=Chondrinema litorale TaxID=2994555 RepID=UPI002543F5D9|nr:DoxX family protein [Chondrinema litorale]UZR95265.1 DoxX family protein [Chondrinema litorale]